MPKSAKSFAFGRKKRTYGKARGRYASKQQDDPVVDPVTELQTMNGAQESQHVSDEETPTPCDEPEALDTSRCEKKLATFIDQVPPTVLDNDRYFLIHTSFLQSLFNIVVCPDCYGSDISYTTSKDIGLAAKFSIQCNTCQATVWTSYTSPKCHQHYDINVRAVLASKERGVSLGKLKDIFNIMNIPHVMHHKTYTDISHDVKVAAKEVAEEVMQNSAEVIKERHIANLYSSEQTSPSGVQVVGVSYDGTWHKRGHSSHYGVGIAIDINSGLVLDTHTVSNYCAGCARAPPKTATSYAEWLQSHKSSCNKNFDGSSNAMETNAAEVIFSRSIESRGLIYGTMLCDGDSKALNRLNQLGVYDITVRKEDCVNHIAKRIYNQLEQLKKDNKAQLNRRLTAVKIKKITNTYATNLREYAPDVEKMKLGVLGGFLHMMSTDSAPNHRLCPDGDTSWCKYKRALAKGETPPPHNTTIPPDVGTFVYPIIKRLTDPTLLARCAKMSTQNPNECFNSTIWKRCPKVNFAHLPSVETAVALSVISFNMGPSGLSKVFQKLGLKWGYCNSSYALKAANTRIRHSKRKGKGVSKWKRKHLQKQYLKEKDKMELEEGVTYSSGAFNC